MALVEGVLKGVDHSDVAEDMEVAVAMTCQDNTTEMSRGSTPGNKLRVQKNPSFQTILFGMCQQRIQQIEWCSVTKSKSMNFFEAEIYCGASLGDRLALGQTAGCMVRTCWGCLGFGQQNEW